MPDDTSGGTDRQALVRALARTGDSRSRQGRQAEATRLYRRALDLAEEAFAPGDPELETIRTSLVALEAAQAASSAERLASPAANAPVDDDERS